jgi:hypothetical protein
MIMSVTPDGFAGPGFVTSVPSLPAGQSAADARADPSDSAQPARTAIVSDRTNNMRILNVCCYARFCGTRNARDDQTKESKTELPIGSEFDSRWLWS